LLLAPPENYVCELTAHVDKFNEREVKAKIISASVSFIVSPLNLSSGAITTLTEAVAEVTARIDWEEITGQGSIYLSDLWVWPDPVTEKGVTPIQHPS